MKGKISCFLAVSMVLGFLPLAMNAQQPEKRYQLFLVIDELVKPSMKAEYFEAAKKWTAFMKDHEFSYPFNTYWTGDNHVYWTMPIQSYAGIGKIMEESGNFREKSPDEYKALEDAFKGTYETSQMCIYALDSKYSMIAEEKPAEAEEQNFVFFDIYYFKPGYEDEIDKLFDEMLSIMAEKKFSQRWYYYWGVMGTDIPVLVCASNAKNAIAFYEENAEMWEALGEEAGKMKKKMMKYVRKQEQKRAWFQKELSYTPAKKEE